MDWIVKLELPVMLYLWALLKMIDPTVTGASTTTLRSAVMMPMNFAIESTPLGAELVDQFPLESQFPMPLVFQTKG